MTVRIINLLEPIQVKKHQSHSLSRAAGLLHIYCKLLFKCSPIKQVGQPIMTGQIFRLLQGMLQLVQQSAILHHNSDLPE
ncbi:hypothetical protein D3C85_1575280 [compost metagenome]